MAASTLSNQDDHTLAAGAVACLAELARRKRSSRFYEVFAHVRDGAAMVETLVIPDQRNPKVISGRQEL